MITRELLDKAAEAAKRRRRKRPQSLIIKIDGGRCRLVDVFTCKTVEVIAL